MNNKYRPYFYIVKKCSKQLLLVLILMISISCVKKQPKSQILKSPQLIEDIDKNEVKDVKSFEIKGSRVHRIKSTSNQKEYDLYIKLPRSYSNSNEEYPLLILTDSDYAFPLVTSISKRLHVEEFITVGISYSKGDRANVSRTRDYTPTYSPNEPRGHDKESRLASGKANDYISFIKNDVFTFLENTYRINHSKKVFAGHSFGGLLACYMLVTNPNLFDVYLAGSPSLWYDKYCINTFEENYAKTHRSLNASVFLCIGQDEDKLASDMVREMQLFEKRLLSRNYSGLKLNSMVISNENHQTVYPSFITKGIQFAFGKNNH